MAYIDMAYMIMANIGVAYTILAYELEIGDLLAMFRQCYMPIIS